MNIRILITEELNRENTIRRNTLLHQKLNSKEIKFFKKNMKKF